MIITVWFAVISVAVIFTIIGLTINNNSSVNIVINLIAGISWFIVAMESANIQEVIVYQNNDYLKEFSFPYLVLLFGLIGIWCMIHSAYQMYNLADREGWLD